jgi:hypothetical protein
VAAQIAAIEVRELQALAQHLHERLALESAQG